MPYSHHHDRRELARVVQGTPTTVAGTATPAAEPAPAPGTVSTVATVSTVPSVPTAPTVSQVRRQGIETPARRATRLAAEAVVQPSLPYGAFTPFVTDEGTVDIAKMVGEMGSEKTAAMLVGAGYLVTPKVVEAIVSGKDVPDMTAADRAILASLAGLTGTSAILYITGGKIGDRETVLAELPTGLRDWYSDNLSKVSAVDAAEYFWPTVTTTTKPGGRARHAGSNYEEVSAKAQYLQEMGFSPAEMVAFVNENEMQGRDKEGAAGYLINKLTGGTAPSGLSDQLRSWYDQQISEMTAVLAKARASVKERVANLKASGKEYTRNDICRIYTGAYPKWSSVYKSHAAEIPRHEKYEAKLATWKAGQAQIKTATVTGIAVGATPEETAAARVELASGKGCLATVDTYKVALRDGTVILVEALGSGTDAATGQQAAIAKAKAAGYNPAWATRRMAGEVVTYRYTPTTDVGLYDVTNAAGKTIQVHAPLGADDSIILEMADAYHLQGDPSGFRITARSTDRVTTKQAAELLSNAELTSGRAYGLMYMTVAPAIGFTVPSGSVPVRTGRANTDVTFLAPGQADLFRSTGTYNKTKGTDIQRLNTAYQEYLNAPKVDLPGGWQMLTRSIRDALGNVLIYGFDSLSPDKQGEIKQEVATAQEGAMAGGAEAPAEEAPAEEILADETTDMAPQMEPYAGATIPMTQEELQVLADANARATCQGEVRYADIYSVSGWNKDHNWVKITVQAIDSSSAKEKALAAGYDAQWVSYIAGGISQKKAAATVSEEAEAEEVIEPVFALANFEADLGNKPKYLQDAYAMGGVSGYNAAVEVYNDTLRSADKVYGGASDAPMQPLELKSRVKSPEFQRQYAAMLQPAGMSDKEYAQIAPYVKPDGIDKNGAFKNGVTGSAFNEFTLANSSQEFRDMVASGETVLLPYGDAIPKREFDKFPDVIQQTLLRDGFPMLAQQEEANKVANVTQGSGQNLLDAFILASVGIEHNLKSAGVVMLRETVRTDFKEGDLDPAYSVAMMKGYNPILWGNGTPYLTGEEAASMNEKGERSLKYYDQLYDDMQKVQLNWEAERPLLQSIYPEGALKALQNLKSAKDIPLILGETIMQTLPYTLATIGVSAVGFVVGGPAGVALAAPIVFGITFGSEGHQIYADALANGASREQAADLMATYGAISAAIETVGDSLFVGAIGMSGQLVSRAIGSNVAATFIRGAAKQYGWAKLTGSMVVQFVNQAGQEAAQQMVANAAIKTFKEERPLFEGVLDAFVGGLIGTAPFILIPSAGQAIRLTRGTTAADIEGKLDNARFRPSDQSAIVEKSLHPLAQLVSSIGNTPVARKAATLYIRVGQLATNYAANAAELAHVRESLSALKGARQLVDQEAATRLRAREQELVKAMESEREDLQSVSQDLVDLLNSLRSLDESAREAVQGIPGELIASIDELVTQTMKGRKRGTPTGRLAGIAGQRAYPVSTFAKTVDDARVAVDTIRGVPKSTKLALRVAVNDMTYALARLGDAIQAAPGMARKAVLDAVIDLEIAVKKVHDLLKSLPEKSKVKLLQTVNEVSNFVASARFAASNTAQIVANDLEYAFTSLEDALKVAPGVVGKAVTGALTDVDIALKKAADAISELPDEAVQELSRAVASMNLAAKDARTYISMYSQVAADELTYGAGLAREAVQAIPTEVSAAARRAGRAAKRKAGEGVLLTRMAAQVIVNDIEYAVQSMVQAIKEAPERAAQAVAAALKKIRASLRSAKLTSVMAIRVAYNDLSYTTQRLVDTVKATPGVISSAAQTAIDGVVSVANKLAGQVKYLATLAGDVRTLAAGDLAYYTDQLMDQANQLVDIIRSTPQVARQTVLDALDTVDREVLALKKRAQELPAAVTRYVDSVAALSQAVRVAIRNKVDFTVLSMELTVYGLEDQARQIRDALRASPERARVLVTDAILTSHVKIKGLPGTIEHNARNYMIDLKRDILRAEENRLQRAYFKVGEDVRDAVKSEFGNIISGRKKLVGETYGPVLDGLADLMTALLRAVQGTELSDTVEKAVDRVTEVVFSGDVSATEKAGTDLENLLATVPGFGKKKGARPEAGTAQQLIRDGGSYIRTRAEDIVKAVKYLVIVEDIQNAESWENTRVKLEDYLGLLKSEVQQVREEQTLSDALSKINWEMEATQEQREPPPVLSIREQMRQTMIQDRVKRLFEACLYRHTVYLDMQSRSEEIRKQAQKNMQDWLEAVHGRDYLDNIIKEVEEQLGSMEEKEIVTPKPAAPSLSTIADEIEKVLKEVEGILKENRDRSPDTTPPDSVQDLRVPYKETVTGEPDTGPAEGRRYKPSSAPSTPSVGELKPTEPLAKGPEKQAEPKRKAAPVAVKEVTETREEEGLTEAEKEALEKAKKEKAKELTEKERKALEEAKKERLAELAKKAVAKEAERRAPRRAYTRPAPTTITRVIAKPRFLPEPELGTREMPEISPAVMPETETEVQVMPAIEIEPAIQTGTRLHPTIQTELQPAIQVETQLQPAIQTATQLQPAMEEQIAVQPTLQEQVAVQTELQTQLQVQPALHTGVQVAVKMPPWWKLPPAQALKEAYKRKVPILLWRMGELRGDDVWKAVIAPQKQVNLLTVIGTDKLPVRPERYATGKGSAARTLQWLGAGPRYSGAADIGVVDVFWDRMGANLRFEGKGLATDVGVRVPSPTTGVTIEIAEGSGAGTIKKAKTPPKSRVVAASPSGILVPDGSLTWASGTIGRGVSRVQTIRWYYLLPPYTGEAIPISGPPHGVTNPKGTEPLDTVQIVGRPRKAAPPARIDLGFAEVRIADSKVQKVIPKMKRIETVPAVQRPGMPMRGSTEEEVAEQVGTAIEAAETEEAAEGLELGAEAGGLELEEEEPVMELRAPKTRVGLPKKVVRSKKPLTDFEYMTTLKGFDPYTFGGM